MSLRVGPASERSLSKFTPGAWLSLGVSRRPGSDDRMSEERSEKSNHNNAKDKTPRFENRGRLGARGQPVGIAHANYSVARQRANLTDIDKDLLNLS